MKGVILAGGFGTRLNGTAKALLDINGKPVLEHILSRISNLVDKTFIVTNGLYFRDFKKWHRNYNGNITIFNNNVMNHESRKGSIGDLNYILNEGTVDDLLVIGSDNLFEDSLNGMIEEHKKKNATIIGLYDVMDISEASKMGVPFLKGNRLVGLCEKPEIPKSTIISTFIYIIDIKDLSRVKEYAEDNSKDKKAMDKMGYLINHLAGTSDVYGVRLEGKWFDVGSLESLERARREFSF